VPFAWWYNDGKDGASHHYQVYSQNLIPLAYNADPSGVAYIDRYYSATAAITLSGTFAIGGRGGNEGTILIKLQRADTGADLATIVNHNFQYGQTLTTNGVTVRMWYTDTYEYYTTISGTYNHIHSGKTYPLRVYLYINTWRGSYKVLNPGNFTVTTRNHTLQ
jgi:hypothetical protein